MTASHTVPRHTRPWSAPRFRSRAHHSGEHEERPMYEVGAKVGGARPAGQGLDVRAHIGGGVIYASAAALPWRGRPPGRAPARRARASPPTVEQHRLNAALSAPRSAPGRVRRDRGVGGSMRASCCRSRRRARTSRGCAPLSTSSSSLSMLACMVLFRAVRCVAPLLRRPPLLGGTAGRGQHTPVVEMARVVELTRRPAGRVLGEASGPVLVSPRSFRRRTSSSSRVNVGLTARGPALCVVPGGAMARVSGASQQGRRRAWIFFAPEAFRCD